MRRDSEPVALRLSHPRYESGALLGRGAQGAVLRVVDREDRDRPLVAKLWHGTAQAEAHAAIAGEFALLSRARIPGLVRAHDLARDESSAALFLVEDFVDGEDASSWLEAVPESARAERLASLLAQAGATLGSLHALGLVHGDLKPAHVRFDAAGRATLLDLGSAVTRDAGAVVAAFTRAYAAPELIAGGRPSIATDLYALGATAYAACVGHAPDAQRARGLRELAPWLAPSLAALVERLLAPHPSDRPHDAHELLRLLGASSTLAHFSGDASLAPIGRERIFEQLLASAPGRVRYLLGGHGAGKSHMTRALVSAALLRGREARLLAFDAAPAPRLDAWLRFLRGDLRELPFRGQRESEAPLLLVLDDVDQAPLELRAALDLFRCRAAHDTQLEVLATACAAPQGAEALSLPPLADEACATLLSACGVGDAARREELARSCAGNPGWMMAALGRVPLSREAVLARTKSLGPASLEALAFVALAGGALEEKSLGVLCGRALRPALAELLAAALVTRRKHELEPSYALLAPGLAEEIALALGSFALVNRLADALLAEPEARAQQLLKVASAANPPERRTALLHAAAAQARAEGLGELELDALFALAADARERTPALLMRLERLTRDSGRTSVHPQVLTWLEECAAREPALAPLMLRRKAEARARAGDHVAAQRCAEEALALVAELPEPAPRGLALATLGAIALYRADWAEAEARFARAARDLPADFPDQEECARLEHNRGVVALYRERAAEALAAFTAALARKRALGDRAGVRACLLNLGLALTKLDRLDDAERALAEGQALAESLGQAAGRAWCLAARADVALRRGNARNAERLIAEAETERSELPAVVRADLLLLRAGVALLDNDGRRCLQEIDAIDRELRAGDALIDARAHLCEARARLLLLPVDRAAVARAARAALRRARGGKLSELVLQARAVLQALRPGRTAQSSPPRYAEGMPPPAAEPEPALWDLLQRMAAGLAPADAAFELARLVVRQAAAERAFVALLDAGSSVRAAFGADIDGFAVADVASRLPLEDLRGALARDEPLYLREVKTHVGVGSRLCVAGPLAAARAVIVIEHRSRVGSFDRLEPERARRWAAVGGVIARLHDSGDAQLVQHAAAEPDRLREPVSASDALPDSTTAFPLRAPRRAFPSILGKSPSLVQALARLDAALDSDLPVLLVGETGTGKELFARALHELGRRARAPMLAINCAAIPDALFEAELFGHARGSFTGAERARSGLLARAQGGTLLLDELGELPLQRQASLLRALETRSFRPVGSDEERTFDVRIVAATNRDLAEAVEQGTFRRDLLFRLNVIEIRVPPLRERSTDVALLAEHYLRASGSQARLAASALAALDGYAWPGNVRELKHLIERLGALPVATIERKHLPRTMRALSKQGPRVAAGAPELEKRRVARALDSNAGNISRAAKQLGLTRHGLKKKMLRLGLRAAARKEGA
jgi:DNA-binding NtrC family response regulator